MVLRRRLLCPHCGVRDLDEFLYGEIPVTPASITDAEARDVDRAFMHENAEGLVAERWFHAFGCRRWVSVKRDTRTNEMV
jgi:heterotetrameric sarcosine oxidase delta subunit